MKLRAFTLIELLVVISIIGILASLLLANFTGIRDRASDAKTKNDLKQVATAFRTQFNDTGAYPTPAVGTQDTCLAMLDTKYMNADDIPANCTYYRKTNDTFTICTFLKNKTDADAIASTTRCHISVSPGRYCQCQL